MDRALAIVSPQSQDQDKDKDKDKQNEVYSISAKDLADCLCEFVHPSNHLKIYTNINSLIEIDQFRQQSECRDLSLEKYRQNRYINFRIVIRNIFSEFYSDNSAFDYPTKNPALKEPYDDRDCYSDVSMDYYREPCVHGSALVLMSDGTEQPAQNITQGMEVKTADGGSAKVKLVVETEMTQPTELVVIGKFILTPIHPIIYEGKWIQPKNHLEAKFLTYYPGTQTGPDTSTISAQLQTSNCVYSYVLDKGHVMLINGVPTICLAHYMTDPAIQRDYLGTNRIVEDLAKFPGYDSGKVRLKTGDFTLYDGQVTLNLPV